MRHKYPKKRMDLEGTVVQQMDYIQWRIHQIQNREKQPLHLLFADLTPAFDRIPRKWLFDSIRLCFSESESVKLFDILGTLYHKTALTYQEAQASFLVTSGVRQGGPERPYFFNLYIDFVMRVFMNNCKKDDSIRFFNHQYGINARSTPTEQRLRMRNENVKLWGSSTVPWCGYANDLILFMLEIHSLQRATAILDEVFTNHSHCVNVSKTETMILNHMLLQDEYPDSIISLCNVALQSSTEFKYCGSYISQNEPNMGDITVSETNHCIQMEYAKFDTMANLLQNSKIHIKTRVKFLNSFVRSRFTYSCQNWNLTVIKVEKLDFTYWKLLRRMISVGFKRIGDDYGDFRYKFNDEKVNAIWCTSVLAISFENNKRIMLVT